MATDSCFAWLIVGLLWTQLRDTTYGLQHIEPSKSLSTAMCKSGYHLVRELRSAASLL